MGRCVLLKTVSAVIDSEGRLSVNPSSGYVGDRNVEMIEIDIGPFADENYDFFVLNFDNGISGGAFPSNVISTAEDKPAYIDNGAIFCPIDAMHTVSGKLKFQLEAHKTVDGVITVRKSSVACISFGESLRGQTDAPEKKNPVYERLADAEGRIASAEGRIADIEKANFAGAIDGLDGRISDIEEYDFSEKIGALGKKLDDLENEFENSDAITSIPAADDKTLGGVKISRNSDVYVNGSGFLGLRYGNADIYALSVLIVIALLSDSGRIETVVGNNVEDISSAVFGMSMQLADGMLEAVVFAAFESGEITWVDENYEERTASVAPNSVYVLRFADGATVLEAYTGSELRSLITEGI